MNQRQRKKIILQQWIIVERIEMDEERYTLYAIDFQRQGRYSWSCWRSQEEMLQFRIPVRCKTGGTRIHYQPCAKIASKAIWLALDEEQYEQLEQLFYQPLSRNRWQAFLQHLNKVLPKSPSE
ncbi:hypothetical protein [Paenibacillus bovis]|uniref:Uncharacterized protein n=1 Tax=Paenibacillus bovis TaxID=1616788 RepID=A0A172ZH16_9BACL|nr:hypothetical protein [Paenibacillus bovis]ANF96430.1 hypothetical protein AR543_10710 [Paenibacillus bovis]